MRTPQIKIKKIHAIAAHRNGITGAPFDVVIFEDHGAQGSLKVAIGFEFPGTLAVLDIGRLAAGDIAFGSNSWRGDQYQDPLREAVKRYQDVTN